MNNIMNNSQLTDKDILKENINEYLNINNEINSLQKKIKNLRLQKNKYESTIILFMKDKNISDINSSNNKIKFNSALRKQNISKKIIENQLKKYLINDNRFNNSNIDIEVNKLMTFIYKNREKTILNENLTISDL